MNCLLDTHALLWYLYDNDRFSPQALHCIQSAGINMVSIVSLWEITIKQSIGKLDVLAEPMEIEDACAENGIDILGITTKHLRGVKLLPWLHKDPFDRMIVSQARCERLTLITKDSRMTYYDVNTAW